MEFGKRGLAWFAAIHRPDEGSDQRNIHAHIVYCPRPVIRIAPGQWKFERRKCREINGTVYPWGTEAPKSREDRLLEQQREGYRRMGFSFPRRDAEIQARLIEVRRTLEEVAAARAANGWKRRTWIKALRENYAQAVNRHLTQSADQGQAVLRRYDARSYRAAGVQKRPTCHMGQGATYAERAGRPTPTGLVNRCIEFGWQTFCEHAASAQQRALADELCDRTGRLLEMASPEWIDLLTVDCRLRINELKKELLGLMSEYRALGKREAGDLRLRLKSMGERRMLMPPPDPAYWARRRLNRLEEKEAQLKEAAKQSRNAGPVDARGRPITDLLLHIRRLKAQIKNAIDDSPRLTPEDPPTLHPALVGYSFREAEGLLSFAEVQPRENPSRRPLGESVLPDGQYIGGFSHGALGLQMMRLEGAMLRFPHELRLAERETKMSDATLVLARSFYDGPQEPDCQDLTARRNVCLGVLRSKIRRCGVSSDHGARALDLCQKYAAGSRHSNTAADSALQEIAVATGVRREASGLHGLWRNIKEGIAGKPPLSQDEKDRLQPILDWARNADHLSVLVAALDAPNDPRPALELTRLADLRIGQLDQAILGDPIGRLVAASRGRLSDIRDDDRSRRRPDGSPVRDRARLASSRLYARLEEAEAAATRQAIPVPPEAERLLAPPPNPSPGSRESKILAPSPAPVREEREQEVVLRPSQPAKVSRQPRGRER